jgi:hypothetical protein
MDQQEKRRKYLGVAIHAIGNVSGRRGLPPGWKIFEAFYFFSRRRRSNP